MKLTKTELAAIALLLLGAGILTGLFIGRSTDEALLLPEITAAAQQTAMDDTAPQTETVRQSDAQPTVVNLNTASAETLTELPGIGEVLAQRIVAYREANGSFDSVEELLNVSGIGEKKLEAIRTRVTVE